MKNPHKVTARTPQDVLAAIAYTVGFIPSNALAVLAMADTRVIAAVTVALPPTEADITDWLAEVVPAFDAAASHGANAALLVSYGDEPVTCAALTAATAWWQERNLAVLDALRVSAGRYYSQLCTEPLCCPPHGRAFDITTTAVAAHATVEGMVVMADRDAYVSQFLPVRAQARQRMNEATHRAIDNLRDLLARADWDKDQAISALRVQGVRAVDEAIGTYRDEGRLDDEHTARLVLYLLHRDVFLHAWVSCDHDEHQIDLWADLTRRANPDLAGAPAALLAFTLWRKGNQALAKAALRRAYEADDTPQLAAQIQNAIDTFRPPHTLAWPPAAGQDPTRVWDQP